MQIRILGAHQSDSADSRSTSVLVDDVLAIDAGSIATALTLKEQEAVQAILLTHQHYDHLKDLPALGLNTMQTGTTNIFSIKETREAVLAHLLNGVLWPDLTRLPTVDRPSLAFFTVEPLHPLDVLGYEVLAVAVSHPVPTVGYQVTRDGRSFFYTSDFGGCGDAIWPHIAPNVLISEVTYPNRMEGAALRAKHLTSSLLAVELQAFRLAKGYMPRVLVVHVSAHFDGEIREEVAEMGQRLGADITVARENMVIEV